MCYKTHFLVDLIAVIKQYVHMVIVDCVAGCLKFWHFFTRKKNASWERYFDPFVYIRCQMKHIILYLFYTS